MFLEQQNQHIRMISEGSCDTEDLNNDAENSDLITEMYYILNIYLHSLFKSNISQYYCHYCIFDQINAVLVSIINSKGPEKTNSSVCIHCIVLFVCV